MKDLYNLACSLTALPSVSGFEEMAFPGLEKICEGRFDEIKTLPTGSFIGIKRCGKANAERLLLDAHLDQIGFVVSGYAGEGFLKVAAVGGIDTRVLCANEVWIYADGGKIPGVFSSVPPHLRGSGDSKKPIKLEDLCVSTYLEEDELKEKVRIGTPVGFKCTPELLANDRMASVQLDDKICIATILRAIDLIKDEHLACDIYALFAGGEEIGYKGAVTGGWDIDPHYAIALDVGGACLASGLPYRRRRYNILFGNSRPCLYQTYNRRSREKRDKISAYRRAYPYGHRFDGACHRARRRNRRTYLNTASQHAHLHGGHFAARCRGDGKAARRCNKVSRKG